MVKCDWYSNSTISVPPFQALMNEGQAENPLYDSLPWIVVICCWQATSWEAGSASSYTWGMHVQGLDLDNSKMVQLHGLAWASLIREDH